MVDKKIIQKLLLIDDDEDDCMVFKMAIGEIDNSIRFLYQHNCDNIDVILQAEQPDLVFLDINLPRVNGIECLQLMHEGIKMHQMPVVMYSSSELPKDLMESFQRGAVLYFRKPNNITTLIDSLKDILQMDWHHPDSIRAQYFKDGRYHVFEPGMPA
jgi:CheY-like chemotaxis protein